MILARKQQHLFWNRKQLFIVSFTDRLCVYMIVSESKIGNVFV